MRGDTHVRFGGRARETDPGNPDTAPVPDPNRSDTLGSCPPAITAGQRPWPDFWHPTRTVFLSNWPAGYSASPSPACGCPKLAHRR